MFCRPSWHCRPRQDRGVAHYVSGLDERIAAGMGEDDLIVEAKRTVLP